MNANQIVTLLCKAIPSLVDALIVLLTKVILFALVLLLAATAVKATGLISSVYIRSLDPAAVCYLCGALYLLRK